MNGLPEAMLRDILKKTLSGVSTEQIEMVVKNVSDAETDRQEADNDARSALEHDDSEWADRQRGYGQGGSTLGQNEAGEWIGYM